VRDNIFQALEEDDMNAIIDFINRGADNVTVTDSYGNSLLNVAAQYGFYEICEFLLKHGVKVDC
jgi:ankyrin repeat protein